MTPDDKAITNNFKHKAITNNFKHKANFYSAMEQDIQEALMTSGDNPLSFTMTQLFANLNVYVDNFNNTVLKDFDEIPQLAVQIAAAALQVYAKYYNIITDQCDIITHQCNKA